ncbi:protein of unknown function [Moritella yayanosii]|uniref:Uncharacterized protein n=1 Tax=Moritella yayanosii TaxID=69539 RepID=A0A330LIX7_9GAMM|nr:protein of unknown function [Moritella yayanosii]
MAIDFSQTDTYADTEYIFFPYKLKISNSFQYILRDLFGLR